jgi:DNA-binding beta-propeller fold protein YncE
MYVADSVNNLIQKVDVFSGNTSILVGSGFCGYLDGIGTNSAFCNPIAVALNQAATMLYVADDLNYRIRSVELTSLKVSTVAGLGMTYFLDGIGSSAGIGYISGMTVDSSGSSLYFVDFSNYRIRQLQLASTNVVTLAGSSSQISSFDGIGTLATFISPQSIAIDPSNSYLLISDGSLIRKLELSSLMVTTLTNTSMFVANPTNPLAIRVTGIRFDVSGLYVYFLTLTSVVQYSALNWTNRVIDVAASLSNPQIGLQGITCDATCSNLFVIDATNNMIDTIKFNNSCPVVPGNYCPAGLSSPSYVQCPAGYYCSSNSLTPILCPAGSYCMSGASSPTPCTAPGAYCPAGSSASLVCAGGYYCPNSAVSMPCSAGYFCLNGSITSSGMYSGARLSVLAGTGQFGNQSGAALSSTFKQPFNVCPDPNSTYLYIADTYGNLIRRMNLSSMQVSTFAGSSVAGSINGIGTAASFNLPLGMAMDPSASNLYVTDYRGNFIRRIVIATATVSTLVGNGTTGYADGTSAMFNGPFGMVIDPSGTYLYVADSWNGRIRRVDVANQRVSTIAGNGVTSACADGDFYTGSLAQIGGIAVDSTGSTLVQ